VQPKRAMKVGRPWKILAVGVFVLVLCRSSKSGSFHPCVVSFIDEWFFGRVLHAFHSSRYVRWTGPPGIANIINTSSFR
jgi:hypothetical protein